MKPGDTPSGPRSDSVAERMLDVAVAQIEAEGMAVGLDQVRMERVIEAAGVSRATAYRRWSNRDAFVADVLVETVRRTSLIPETEQEVGQLVALVAARRGELHTRQGRRDLVVEALRISIDLDVRRIMASPRWRTYHSLSATYPSLPAGRVRDAVGGALIETERAFCERRAGIYANLAGLVGYRLVPPLAGHEGFLTMAGAAGAMMTGIVTRTLPDPAWLDRRTPGALFGASREAAWSDPERFVVGLVLGHIEPDPTLTWDSGHVDALLGAFADQVSQMYATSGHPPFQA
ncbi:hypothetical protein GCM10028815_23900 [Mariniluteicoccus flavus]